MDRYAVGRVRLVATSAARDASNRDEFFTAVVDVVGAQPELLSGEDEGRLSFAGATAELDPAEGPFMVADIGGGSTELIVGTADSIAVRPLDVGCVRLPETYLVSAPPAPEELSDALTEVRDLLEDVRRELPEISTARRLVGVAGTVTTVAAVEMGLAAYDRQRIHHFEL